MSEELHEEITQEADIIEAKAVIEANADMLVDISERLEKLEAHFTPQGLDNLARNIEQRIVSRLRYGCNPQIEVIE